MRFHNPQQDVGASHNDDNMINIHVVAADDTEPQPIAVQDPPSQSFFFASSDDEAWSPQTSPAVLGRAFGAMGGGALQFQFDNESFGAVAGPPPSNDDFIPRGININTSSSQFTQIRSPPEEWSPASNYLGDEFPSHDDDLSRSELFSERALSNSPSETYPPFSLPLDTIGLTSHPFNGLLSPVSALKVRSRTDTEVTVAPKDVFPDIDPEVFGDAPSEESYRLAQAYSGADLEASHGTQLSSSHPSPIQSTQSSYSTLSDALGPQAAGSSSSSSSSCLLSRVDYNRRRSDVGGDRPTKEQLFSMAPRYGKPSRPSTSSSWTVPASAPVHPQTSAGYFAHPSQTNGIASAPACSNRQAGDSVTAGALVDYGGSDRGRGASRLPASTPGSRRHSPYPKRVSSELTLNTAVAVRPPMPSPSSADSSFPSSSSQSPFSPALSLQSPHGFAPPGAPALTRHAKTFSATDMKLLSPDDTCSLHRSNSTPTRPRRGHARGQHGRAASAATASPGAGSGSAYLPPPQGQHGVGMFRIKQEQDGASGYAGLGLGLGLGQPVAGPSGTGSHTATSEHEIARPNVTSEATRNAALSRRTKEAKFVCPVCGTDFTAKHNFDRHRKAHDGVRPFECACGTRFTSKSDRKRHVTRSQNPVCQHAVEDQ